MKGDRTMANLENLRVERGGDQYCLAWTCGHRGYHIWLSTDFKITGGARPLFYRPVAGENQVSRLSLAVPKNKAMVDDAITEATVQHLFEKHEQDLILEKARRQKAQAERQAAERVREAAPEMLALLEAVAEFWSEYEKFQTPLHPGAMITEKDECIAELVREVVRKARGQQ